MIRHVRPRALALAPLLVAAPLPFGSVAPGPATVLLVATLAALALALWTPETVETPTTARTLPRELAVAATALAAIALLGWLQSLPAPAALAQLLAPESVRLTRQAHELAGPAPGRSADETDERLRRTLARAGGEPLGGARLAPPRRRLFSPPRG